MASCDCGNKAIIGISRCASCRGQVRRPPCTTPTCMNKAVGGQTLCYPCGNTALSLPSIKWQNSQPITITTVSLASEEDLKAVQAEVENLRRVIACILALMSEMDSKYFREFPVAKANYEEAQALLGQIATTEIVKDLRQWEGELDGD